MLMGRGPLGCIVIRNTYHYFGLFYFFTERLVIIQPIKRVLSTVSFNDEMQALDRIKREIWTVWVEKSDAESFHARLARRRGSKY
jgi:hypothetical protein